jgi:hypothetical protein
VSAFSFCLVLARSLDQLFSNRFPGSLHSTGDGNAVRTAGPSTTAATDEKAAGEDKPKRVGFKFGLKKKGADGKSIFEP